MKNVKVINVEALLTNLDSTQLKELRKQFNQECTKSMRALEDKEREQMCVFVDGLRLDRSYFSEELNVVSLNRWRLPMEQRQKLDSISSIIGKAFDALKDLKCEVANEAKRNGTPFSRVFHSTLKRMTKYKDANPHSRHNW